MLAPEILPFFPWIAGVVGLVLGSFYTVCVHRYLTGESVVLPASHCHACSRPLRWWENVPLVSFALLKGRCPTCKAAIPWRYPAMEALSAAWAVLIALKFGPGLAWLCLMGVGGVFLVASFIDLEIYILPDVLIYPGMALGLVTGVFGLGQPLADCLIGAGVGAGFFWLLRFAYMRTKGVEGLGLGDVKLMFMIGGITGWMGLPMAVLLGALSALVVFPLYLIPGGRLGGTRVPFGPFLCLGCMLSVLWGLQLMLFLAGR